MGARPTLKFGMPGAIGITPSEGGGPTASINCRDVLDPEVSGPVNPPRFGLAGSDLPSELSQNWLAGHDDITRDVVRAACGYVTRKLRAVVLSIDYSAAEESVYPPRVG